MLKDFVEIQPVRLEGNEFVPVYGETCRAFSRLDVSEPGTLDFTPNPDFVDGAYENLKHADARPAMTAAGLSMSPGTVHHVPLDRVEELFPVYSLVADADGYPSASRIQPMAMAMQAALTAARKADAPYIEIRIS